MTAHRISIAASVMMAVGAIVWSCAGQLDNIDAYRNGAGVQASCFGASPPKFLQSAACTQCHLSKGNGVGAALDLKSDDIGGRLSTLTGSCPQALLIDPAHPAQSTLYLYMDDQVSDCTYSKMPPTGASVSAADKHCLLTWIDGLDGVDDLHLDAEGGGSDGGPTGGDGDGDAMDDSEPPPSLQQLEDTIFGPICGSCHASGVAPQGLVLGPSLSETTLHANIVGVSSQEAPSLELISPGDPANSFLLLKVKGLQDTATCTSSCGAQMPKGGTPLTAQQISDIEAWVAAGAH